MTGSRCNFIQTGLYFFHIVQAVQRDIGHSYDTIHWSSDIMRHGRKKCGPGLVAVLRLLEGICQMLTHIMFFGCLLKHGKILAVIRRNHMDCKPALHFIGAIPHHGFPGHLLIQCSVQETVSRRIIRRHSAGTKYQLRPFLYLLCSNSKKHRQVVRHKLHLLCRRCVEQKHKIYIGGKISEQLFPILPLPCLLPHRLSSSYKISNRNRTNQKKSKHSIKHNDDRC